jgi:tetratricopeptide (TPR) repeat protein
MRRAGGAVRHRPDSSRETCSMSLNRFRFTIPAAFLLGLAVVLPAGADAKDDLDAALVAVHEGDLDTALAAAQRVPQGDAWHADALFCIAWVHAQRGDAEGATDSYQQVVKLRPRDARAWNNLGSSLDDLGRLEEALSAYDRSIALDPVYAPAHNNRGVTLDKMGEGSQAAQSFERAIEIDPEYAAPHNNLGAWYYEIGDRQAASRQWARAAALDPSYVSPLVNNAVLDFEGEKESLAEKRLMNLVKAGRATADVWFNLGVFAHKRFAHDKALEYMEEADALRPRHAETLNNLGILYLHAGSARRAERALRACIEVEPEMAKAWDNLGLVLYRVGRYDEAREAFEREIEIDPELAFAHYNLGCALAAEGKVDEAAKSFEKATEIAPGHIEAMHNLAVLMNEKKDRDPDRELALYHRIIDVDDQYAPVHLSLGRFYQSEPGHRNLEKAFRHYDRFVKLGGGDVETVEEVMRTMRAIQKRLDAGLK